MTTQQLGYTLAVDWFRRSAKVVERYRVMQPTLSAIIQKPEDELGVKPFDRSTTSACSTSIGKKVPEQARKTPSETTCVEKIINEGQYSLSDTFRLTVLPMIAPYLLPYFSP